MISSPMTDLTSAAAVTAHVGLGLVLMTAGLQKLRRGAVFLAVVANYRLLRSSLVRPVALVLPWIELTVGGLLLLHGAGPWPALAAIGLLAIFAFAMAVNIRRGRAHIDCGCHHSALRQPLRWSLVARNLMLCLVLASSLSLSRDVGPVPALVGAAAGIVAFVLYILFNTLAAIPALDRSPA
jgi:uncharacterized membrane protein YphA (DoxX/SURF4 family)